MKKVWICLSDDAMLDVFYLLRLEFVYKSIT